MELTRPASRDEALEAFRTVPRIAFLTVEGQALFYAYQVDNQAIVVPETIDAQRALSRGWMRRRKPLLEWAERNEGLPPSRTLDGTRSRGHDETHPKEGCIPLIGR